MKIDWEPPDVRMPMAYWDFLDVYVRHYQGAFVDCFNTGLYIGDIFHIDCKSMYPSIMIMLNLSPESTRVLERSVWSGKYDFGVDFVEVPDSRVGQLRLGLAAEDSVTRRIMVNFREMRERIRSKPKTKATEGHEKGIKVLMNAIYGYHGLEYARYGFFPIAIATTSVGRLIMQTIIKICQEQGVTLLEVDTDGIYQQGKDVGDIVNRELRSMFECYSPFSQYVGVDVNLYDAILVYSAKNYILRKDGHNRFKGSAFHGRHMPRICRVALEKFTDAFFTGDSVKSVWSDFVDLRGYPLNLFTMSVQFRKDPREYESTTMYANLARKIGEHVRYGENIYYVKCKSGYYPIGYFKDSELKRRIDYGYYMGRVRDVVKRLFEAVEPQRKGSLMEFL